jgi:hypothetical protein
MTGNGFERAGIHLFKDDKLNDSPDVEDVSSDEEENHLERRRKRRIPAVLFVGQQLGLFRKRQAL